MCYGTNVAIYAELGSLLIGQISILVNLARAWNHSYPRGLIRVLKNIQTLPSLPKQEEMLAII
jgi:hypothetical protein